MHRPRPIAPRTRPRMLRPLPRLALALAIVAIAGCGRGSAPPARVERSSLAAAPRPIPPPPAPGSVPMEPREPGDRCQREPGQPPRPLLMQSDSVPSTYYEAIGQGLAFRCILRDGHPVRLVLQADSYGSPAAVLVYDPPAATAAPDTLLVGKVPGETEPPYLGAPMVEGEDLDGDGWADVRVMTFHGTGGHVYDVFRYDPRRSRFAKDTVLSGMGNVHREDGCVRTSWKMGIGNDSWLDYCWRDGRWVAVRGERWERSDSLSTRDVLVSIHQREELRGGRMRVVHADTTRERIR